MTPAQGPEETRYSPAFARALGTTIKVVRTDLGIDRRALADAAAISYSYLTEIENGNKPPSSQVLEAIARALGLRLSELIQAAEERVDRVSGPWGLSRRYYREDLRSLAFGSPPPPHPDLWDEWRPETPPPKPPFRSEPTANSSGAADGRFEPPALPGRAAAMSPSFRGPNSFRRTALLELENLLRRMSPDDVARLLDLARRLASR